MKGFVLKAAHKVLCLTLFSAFLVLLDAYLVSSMEGVWSITKIILQRMLLSAHQNLSMTMKLAIACRSAQLDILRIR